MVDIDRQYILDWLRQDDPAKLEELWQLANQTRIARVGNEVHLRGLIEISNHCARQCTYCGLRADRTDIHRYRMTSKEILDCAHKAVSFSYGTVVMQAGEDYGIKTDWLTDVIKQIKAETNLAVTLSMGERPLADIEQWRDAGADRYLLRFETSDEDLYNKIHPPLAKDQMSRIDLLKKIKQLGYEAGSGVMIGIPGQTYDSLANDIMLFRQLDLDMIGTGPYITHDQTPLFDAQDAGDQQVSATELMTYKVVALTRLACPAANIPSTTALATINKATGRENGLNRGANILMPNMTPIEYRKHYEIYPAKVCINETADECRFCMKGRILSIGRTPGIGQGPRIN